MTCARVVSHVYVTQYEERDGLNTNKLKKPFSSISNFGKRKSPKPLVR
jgi:hypothetical protein